MCVSSETDNKMSGLQTVSKEGFEKSNLVLLLSKCLDSHERTLQRTMSSNRSERLSHGALDTLEWIRASRHPVLGTASSSQSFLISSNANDEDFMWLYRTSKCLDSKTVSESCVVGPFVNEESLIHFNAS